MPDHGLLIAVGEHRTRLHLRLRGDVWHWDCYLYGERQRGTTGERDRRRAEAAALLAVEAVVTARGRPGRGEGVDLAALAALDLARAEAEGVVPQWQRAIGKLWDHVCRVLGAERAPDTLTYQAVEDYIRQRREEGARGQTIVREVHALRRGMEIAHRDGLLDHRLEHWPRVRRDPRSSRRGKLHTPELLRAWLLAIDSEPKVGPEARAQAEVILLTGLRVTEARRMTWAWVQAAPRGSELPAILVLPESATKDRDERIVGLVPRALELLEAARRRVGDEAALMPSDHKRSWARAARAIGYAGRISARDLRHCHATYAATAMGDLVAVQQALGHADLRTTQLYLSASGERTAQVAAAVASTMGMVTATVTSDGEPGCAAGATMQDACGSEGGRGHRMLIELGG